jgi:hypothetical protein
MIVNFSINHGVLKIFDSEANNWWDFPLSAIVNTFNGSSYTYVYVYDGFFGLVTLEGGGYVVTFSARGQSFSCTSSNIAPGGIFGTNPTGNPTTDYSVFVSALYN